LTSAPGPQTRDFFTRSVLRVLAAPINPPALAPASDIADLDLERFAGDYRHYRWAFTTVEKMLQLTSQFSVKATKKGTLMVTGRLSPGEYAPVDQRGLFQHVATGELLHLAPGYGGRMTLNQGTFPFVTAYQLKPWETQAFNAKAYWIFVSGLSALGIFGLFAAYKAFAASRPGAGLGFAGLGIALLSCGIGFYFFISIAQGLSELDVQAGPPAIANILLSIPLIAGVIALAIVIGSVLGFLRPKTIGGGIYSLVSLIALGAFMAYLGFWNGLGWQMP
jgi:hypothetical protein